MKIKNLRSLFVVALALLAVTALAFTVRAAEPSLLNETTAEAPAVDGVADAEELSPAQDAVEVFDPNVCAVIQVNNSSECTMQECYDQAGCFKPISYNEYTCECTCGYNFT